MTKQVVLDFFKLLAVFFIIGISVNNNTANASFLFDNLSEEVKSTTTSSETDCY